MDGVVTWQGRLAARQQMSSFVAANYGLNSSSVFFYCV